MLHKLSISKLLENLDKDSIESILPKEKRKIWNQTETEEDYLKRSGAGAHNRAAGALMWLDPRARKSFRNLAQRGISIKDKDLGNYKLDSTKYNFNVTPDDIDESLLVSNWRRLKVRQLWQDAVYSNTERTNYWSDSSKVRAVHGLGLFDNEGSTEDQIGESLSRLERMIGYEKSGNKAELSCIGVVEGAPQDREALGFISIEFTQRKIVWAAMLDAWTQFLSSADDDTRNYFQIRKEIEDEENPMAEKIFDAALVKFPGETRLHDQILFSENDVKKMTQSYIGELIITDWSLTPDDVIITLSKSIPTPMVPEITNKIQELAKEYFGPSAEFLIDIL